jgi:hypothetical protein
MASVPGFFCIDCFGVRCAMMDGIETLLFVCLVAMSAPFREHAFSIGMIGWCAIHVSELRRAASAGH